MGRRRRRWLVLLGTPLAAALLAWIWWTGRGLPTRVGEATLPGLSAPVVVRFDAQGVPHVTAGSSLDVAAALGWLHANDRMTQLELGRRAASGRLSEIFGELALGVDTRARQLRLRETAGRLFEASGPESRALLEAYARGVNAWLDEQGSSVPSELVLLGVEPEPWTPTDSLCFHMLMARDLSLYRDEEQRRFGWLAGLGLERTRELAGLPDLSPHPRIAALAAELGRGQDVEDAAGEEAELAEPVGVGTRGSNNWALGATLTRSGRPIVAGDPHLGLGLPALWFQATLRSPEYSATGMTLPGLPVVVIGQSQDIGWAFTNTELDVSDIFFEELNPAGDAVRRGDLWSPIQVEQVTLHTSGGDRTIELRSTDLGPFMPATPGWPAHSLAWTGHESFDPLATFTGLARATTIEEVDEALRGFVCPVQNILVGLSGGDLYFTLLGLAPERGRGAGRLPLPGWDTAWHWRGLRPHSQHPRILNPAGDLLSTANNDVRPANYVGSFSADPDTGHRHARILAALAERQQEVGGLVPADSLLIQQDTLSLYAVAVVAALASPLEGASAQAERARELLAAWNGDMHAGPEPALFAIFERGLAPALLGDELEGLPHLSSSARRRLILRRLDSRAAALPAALEQAWEECVDRFGRDLDDWDYTRLHTLELRHPLGVIPVLGGLFNRGPFRMPGSSTTIAAFSGGVSTPWHEHVSHGPSMRFVADIGNPDGSLAVLPGGQSGHPFDEHYEDQLEAFLEGRAFPVLWSEAAIGAATFQTLRLVP